MNRYDFARYGIGATAELLLEKRESKGVMKDPRIAKMMEGGTMPMDPKRMRYGGFKVLVDL